MTLKEHIKEFEKATGKSGTYSRAAKKFVEWMLERGKKEISSSAFNNFTDGKSASYKSIVRQYCSFVGIGNLIPVDHIQKAPHKYTRRLKKETAANPFIEQWVEVVDAVGYMVSNFGRIKNMSTGRILKVTESKKDRYCRIAANWKRERGYTKNRETRTHHSIVFFSFNPELYPPTRDKHIDHIDRDPTNNRLDNLRYVTIVENMKNRFRISSNVISEICEMYSNGHSVSSIYDVLGQKYHLFSQRKTK